MIKSRYATYGTLRIHDAVACLYGAERTSGIGKRVGGFKRLVLGRRWKGGWQPSFIQNPIRGGGSLRRAHAFLRSSTPSIPTNARYDTHDVRLRPFAEVASISSICLVNRSRQSGTMSTLADRLKAATTGFGITAAPLCIIAVTQFIFIPQIAESFAGLDNNERAWAVSSLRKEWFTFHAAAVISVAMYWFLVAVLGRGKFLRFRTANAALALFAVAILAIVLYYSFGPWDVVLSSVCPFLGISDTDAPPFGFDTPSSCGAFVYGTQQVILLGLLGSPILLLTVSLAARIFSSRRATPGDA